MKRGREGQGKRERALQAAEQELVPKLLSFSGVFGLSDGLSQRLCFFCLSLAIWNLVTYLLPS